MYLDQIYANKKGFRPYIEKYGEEIADHLTVPFVKEGSGVNIKVGVGKRIPYEYFDGEEGVRLSGENVEFIA